MIDTIRVLVDWKCNLSCTYCCNDQERFRREITPTRIESIDFARYEVVCITGGEPLLFPKRIHEVCTRVPAGKLIVLYTNGIYLDRRTAEWLVREGVRAINVGLHKEPTFPWLIDRVRWAVNGLGMSVRFQAQDIYRERLTREYPDVQFRFWEMDDCARDNEERVVLHA